MTYLFSLLALVGLGSILTGLWWVYPPLACVLGGAVSILLAYWGDKAWGS